MVLASSWRGPACREVGPNIGAVLDGPQIGRFLSYGEQKVSLCESCDLYERAVQTRACVSTPPGQGSALFLAPTLPFFPIRWWCTLHCKSLRLQGSKVPDQPAELSFFKTRLTRPAGAQPPACSQIFSQHLPGYHFGNEREGDQKGLQGS